MEPLIITAAVVGAELSRDDTPYLPLTPVEIADQAAHTEPARRWCIFTACGRRFAHGYGVYRRIIQSARSLPDIIIRSRLVGRWHDGSGAIAADLSQARHGEPDDRTVNFGEGVFTMTWRSCGNSLAPWPNRASSRNRNLDSGMIATALRLVKEGLLIPPLHFDLVMGAAALRGLKICRILPRVCRPIARGAWRASPPRCRWRRWRS
jgi:3-keto-5-aminohexanoate cleavage enzyme